MGVKSGVPFFGSIVVPILFIALSERVRSQDNLFRVRTSTALSFVTPEAFKVGPGTTIEISFRPMSDFVPKSGAFVQCLAHCGDADNLAFALLLTSDFETGQARLGIVSKAADAASSLNYVLLTKPDSAGDIAPMKLERGRTYHASIVIVNESGVIDVYLDGHPQGEINCKLDATKSSKSVLRVGGKPNIEGYVPFDGEIGGLRFWNRSLPEPSVIALQKFGRTCDPFELSMVLEYGFLMAYGDFRGSTPAKCKLVFPNANFGGVWRENISAVPSNVDGKGTFLDFPVYTILPDSNNEYQVYEDNNYIGQLKPTSLETQGWQFVHSEGNWPAIDFAIAEVVKAGRPTTQLVCRRLPVIPRPLAGKKTGDITLVRGSLDEDGAGISTQKFFSKLEKDRNRLTGDTSAAFMMGNNVRYKNVLYRGYNFVTMNKFNLFDNGVDRNDNYLFAQPEQGLFAVDTDQIRLLPADLAINNLNMGESSSQSYYVSNAMEYSQVVTSRMGGGVSSSLTVGTGTATGATVSVSGTVSMNIVIQSENTAELQKMETTNQDKMISISSYRHYDLLHKKDLERLDPKFRNTLLSLYAEAKNLSPSARDELLFQFFEQWGTHFVYGGTFGAIKWTERTIDEKTSQTINRQSWNQFVSVNEGKSGTESELSKTLTDTLKDTSETIKSTGGNTAGEGPAGPGDEPAPIELDLRLISQLCSPQFFPENPEIFNDLRIWLDLAYPNYLRLNVVKQLQMQNPSPEFQKKVQQVLESGKWDALEPKLYVVQIDSAQFNFVSAATGQKLAAEDLERIHSLSIAVNLNSAVGQSQYQFLQKANPTKFATTTSKNAHFIPFQPSENDIVKVSVDALVNIRSDNSFAPKSVSSEANARPSDVEFYFDPKLRASSKGPLDASVQQWTNALKQANPLNRFLADRELKRPRQYDFVQTEVPVPPKSVQPQVITHVLGPFSAEEDLPAFCITVTAGYKLMRVAGTSSLWANSSANSRAAIKSADPRFGTFLLGPSKSSVDFLKNRSTTNLFKPPRAPALSLTKAGDGK